MIGLQALVAQQNPPTKAPPRDAAPGQGTISDNIYRNPSFGLSYKIPYAWVDRTQQMNEDATEPAKHRVLLAAFERPPQVVSDTINSGVVIAAESASAYPGMKSAAQYFEPLTEASEAVGFKADGDPYDVTIGAKVVVRRDFKNETRKVPAYQSSLVVLMKGYVLSFTFLSGSQDEVEKLIEGLSFTTQKVPPK